MTEGETQEELYSVALWRFWNEREIPYTEDVYAQSALLAALHVMNMYDLRYVQYAAVCAPDKTYTRWHDGLKLHKESA